jgi:DNA-binding IscR family transcriptional regulator
LFGAELAFAHQNLASYRRELQGASSSPSERESIALRIAIQTAQAFRDSTPAPTAEDLAAMLDAPVRTVRGVLDDLEAIRILSQRTGARGEIAYQLGQPADRIRVADVLASVRGAREPVKEDEAAVVVERMLAQLDAGARTGGAGQTLAELTAEVQLASESAQLRLATSSSTSLDPSSASG